MLAPRKKSYYKPGQHIKKQRHHFANKGPYSQRYSFSSSPIWMWQLDHKEGWLSKNWCFWTVVLEKTLESSLDSKEIKPVNPKGNQPWIFIGSWTDAELKLQYFEHLMWRSDSLEKTPMLGKIEGRKGREWQRMRWLDDITASTTWVWANFGRVEREAWCAAVRVVTKTQRWLCDWTTEIIKTFKSMW